MSDKEFNADLPDDPEEKRTFAYENGQITRDSIRIGVGNFSEDADTDDKKAAEVHCDFFLQGPNTDGQKVKRVHPGTEFDFEGYHIRVHLLAQQNGRWLAGVGIKDKA